MALRFRDITRSTPQTLRPLTTAVAMASLPQPAAAFYTGRENHGSRLASVHHVTLRLRTVRRRNRQKSTRLAHVRRLDCHRTSPKCRPNVIRMTQLYSQNILHVVVHVERTPSKTVRRRQQLNRAAADAACAC